MEAWLGRQDSNLNSWNQNPESCRWTTAQWEVPRRRALPACGGTWGIIPDAAAPRQTVYGSACENERFFGIISDCCLDEVRLEERF